MATHWTLEDLYRGVMQSWLVLVGTIVALTLAGVGVFLVYPQKYTAEAQHTVEPISVLSTGSSFNTVNMETEKVVATSTAVLSRAVEELDDTTVEALRANTVIEVPRNSQVLIFQVTANSPELAAERANALATAYGEQRTDNARAVVERTTEELGQSITELQALVQSQAEGSSERAATQLQLQALLDQQALITATPFYSGMLVTPADPPRDDDRPSVLVFIAGGMFLGILLGAIAALIVSRVRNSPGHSYKRSLAEEDDGDDEEDGDVDEEVEEEDLHPRAHHRAAEAQAKDKNRNSRARPLDGEADAGADDDEDAVVLDDDDSLIEPEDSMAVATRPRSASKRGSKKRR